MTRVTNFGRKRTYVEAGFTSEPQEPTVPAAAQSVPQELHDAVETGDKEKTDQPPPKKKRKRTKMSKRDGNAAKNSAGELIAVEGAVVKSEEADNGREGEAKEAGPSKTPGKAAKKNKKNKEKRQKFVSASEARRLKRIEEKQAGTTCFACREKGHAAKNCPKATTDDGKGKSVGICYRCGSTRHTLSRCKKLADPENPMPFASCFVCSGKGHLASACPQNKAKGVYPNGGCCKVCGDTSHLAKDCGLRRQDVGDSTALLGTGREAGADEDDFHTFKRKTKEVEREEKQEDKMKKLLEVKTGAHSGVVKAFGHSAQPKAKKVVYF